MNPSLTSRTALVLLAAALVGACSDPAPAPPAGPVLEGAPIDGSAAAPPASEEFAIGDVSTPEERAPEDRVVSTAPPPRAPEPAAPVATAPAAPEPAGAATSAAPDSPDPALPALATTAAQADKPAVPEKPAVPAASAAPAVPAVPDAAKPAAAKAVDAAKSLLPKDRTKGAAVELTWDQLASFEFVPPPPVYSDPVTGVFPDQTAAIEKATQQIPPEIWELEGETITVEGFMIPLEYVDEGVRSFLVSRHAMGCCFGVMPRPHELVECDMGEGKSVPYVGYLPVRVTGKLHIGLKAGPSVILAGIYRMDAPTMTVPKER